jgi:hypothetical protein
MNPNSPNDATNHILHPMKLPQIVEDTVVAVRVSLIGAQRLSVYFFLATESALLDVAG